MRCRRACQKTMIAGSILPIPGAGLIGAALCTVCLPTSASGSAPAMGWGLEEAMRGIQGSGGSIEVEWPLERALQIADQTVGVSVLEELYKRMRATPVSPDLEQLWKELGIERRGETVVFDDSPRL